MRITKPEQLINHLLLCHKTKVSTLILGKISVGKSQIVKKVYEQIKQSLPEDKRYKCYFYDVRVSQMDISDIKGLFKIENGYTIFCPPKELYDFTDPEASGVLFFDEINLAGEDIQSTLYKIVLDRMVDNRPISNNVLIVAAGNTNEEVSMVNDISPALLNRFSVIKYEPDNHSILDYLKNKYKGNIVIETIIDFLKGYDAEIFMENIKEDYTQFGRPRGWERIFDLIVIDNILNINELVDNYTYAGYASSGIGEYAYSHLRVFIQYIKDIDIEQILKMKDKELETYYNSSFDKSKRFALLSALNIYCKNVNVKLKEQEVDKLANLIEDKIIKYVNATSPELLKWFGNELFRNSASLMSNPLLFKLSKNPIISSVIRQN